MKKAFFVVMSLVMVFAAALPAFAADYPAWDGFPNSPVSVQDYPFQVIYQNYLFASTQVFYVTLQYNTIRTSGTCVSYVLDEFGSWVSNPALKPPFDMSSNITAANQDVKSGSATSETVFFSAPILPPYMIQVPVMNQLKTLPSGILGTFSTVFPIGLALLGMLLGVSLIGSILRRTVFS